MPGHIMPCAGEKVQRTRGMLESVYRQQLDVVSMIFSSPSPSQPRAFVLTEFSYAPIENKDAYTYIVIAMADAN